MSEPKRYDPVDERISRVSHALMESHESGAYVLYRDYQDLRAQVAGLTEALRLMVTAADLVRTEWLKSGNVAWNSPEAEALKSALINHGRKALAEAAG